MIETVADTASTNADLLDRIKSGQSIAEGYWLRAERQSGGRGRSGRAWVSEPGNIYASTVVSIGPADPPAHTLSLVTGLAVLGLVKKGLEPARRGDAMLKWPNDVLVSGAKIAGILLERHANSVVVGIGVNINHAPNLPDRATTSLAQENPHHPADPAIAMPMLADNFASQLSMWREFGTEALIQRWCSGAHPLGTPLSVHDPSGEKIAGAFDGLDPSGSLLLRMADGNSRIIHAGDVVLV